MTCEKGYLPTRGQSMSSTTPTSWSTSTATPSRASSQRSTASCGKAAPTESCFPTSSAASAYSESLDSESPDHDATVAEILEQSVRREAHGSSIQRPWRRRVENLLLGDARKRGETHQWMWDRLNLRLALEEAGFHSVEVVDYDRSRIPGWNEVGLDLGPDGGEYKSGSGYIEAVR